MNPGYSLPGNAGSNFLQPPPQFLDRSLTPSASQIAALILARHGAAILCLLLTGCATGPTVPKVTLVPVAQSCIKGEPPAKPQTSDEIAILGMDEFSSTITIFYERLALKAYAEKADALIQACR